MTCAITVGEGLARAQGRLVQVNPPPVEGVIAALSQQPQKLERWWSVHHWERAYRTAKGWQSSIGVAVDLDYKIDDEAPTTEAVTALTSLARSGKLPGSIFHLTPHGARVVFVYEMACTHREMQISASKGAASLVDQALAAADLFDYAVDPCSWDLARLYFTHNAIAKGVPRNAELVMMRAVPYEVDFLCGEEPPEEAEAEPEPVRVPVPRREYSESIDDLTAKWNDDHRQEWPTRPGDCPACGHRGCFKTFPGAEDRWYCFSTNHVDGVGVRSERGYHGDALDLEAYARGCKPIDVLRSDGYLRQVTTLRVLPAPQRQPTATAEPQRVIEPSRPLRSRSYLTAVTIVEQNVRDVLGGKKLELNEMSGRMELGRSAFDDNDMRRIRSNIERCMPGGIDRDGNEIGLQLSEADVFSACSQVAAAHAYHPIRDYLTGLGWDCVDRIDSIPEDVLGVANTELNRAIFRRFMISAVARAMNPGCKVDTVLILVGEQGKRKSSVFAALAGEWFVDSFVDIRNKDSYQVLRQAWIYEWGELSVMNRADAETIKAFVTSPKDTYRPPHGRTVVDVPRGCVIVGSTNRDEFLADDTGNRRFWPLRVVDIRLDLLVERRDQLWAEAMARYRAGEQWWLTDHETQLLEAVHDEHFAKDVWEGPILSWVLGKSEVTLAEILGGALDKAKGQWTSADARRVGAVLRRTGWRPAGRAWVKK